jgi:hypothetical protein
LLGTALLGAILTGLGLSKMLTRATVLASLLLCAFGLPLALSLARRLLGSIQQELPKWADEPISIRFLAGLLVAVIAMHGIAAYVRPPVGDAEAFYMVYPKIIAATERLTAMPGLYAAFSSIGLPAELHFAALMLLADPHAAKLFVWPVCLSAAAMLAGIGIQVGLARKANLFALVMLFSSPTFTHYISDGKVDLFAAAFGLAAFYWALSPRLARGDAFVIALIGLFAGLATVAKLSYLVAFFPPLLVLVAWRLCAECDPMMAQREKISLAATRLMQVGLWAALAWTPHFVKNAVLFSAPLAPLWGGPQDKSWLQQVWFSAETTRWIVLTYPLALVFGRYPMQGGGLSFLLIAFLPLIFLLRPSQQVWRSRLALITCAGLLAIALWVALQPSIIAPRYLLASLLLLIPLIAKATEHAWNIAERWSLLRIALFVSLIAAFLIAIYPVLPAARLAIEFARGKNIDPCALAGPHCAPLSELNREAALGDRIFMATYNGYWLRPDLLQCRDSPDDDHAIQSSPTPFESLHDRGFRFVILDKTSHRRILSRLESSSPPSWLSVEQLFDSPHLAIWRLVPESPPRKPAFTCRQLDAPMWEVVALHR